MRSYEFLPNTKNAVKPFGAKTTSNERKKGKAENKVGGEKGKP